MSKKVWKDGDMWQNSRKISQVNLYFGLLFVCNGAAGQEIYQLEDYPTWFFFILSEKYRKLSHQMFYWNTDMIKLRQRFVINGSFKFYFKRKYLFLSEPVLYLNDYTFLSHLLLSINFPGNNLNLPLLCFLKKYY